MKLFCQVAGAVKRAIVSLENSKTPFAYYALTFFFAVTLRNFIEVFSTHCTISLGLFTHYYLYYVSLAMLLVLVFWAATKEKVPKIARVVLPAFIVVNLAPLLDLLISQGRGYVIAYALPGIHGNLLLRFFTFGGEFADGGVTPGMKIEVAIVLLACFAYFYLKGPKLSKSLKLAKSLFWTLAVYVLIFAYYAVLFIIKPVLEFAGLEYQMSNFTISNFYLVVIFLAGIFLAHLANRRQFKSVAKEMPFARLAHFELMFVLGLVLGLQNATHSFQTHQFFGIATTMIAIGFACLYSMFLNNITDCQIDRVSNRERALVKKSVSLRDYERASWLFLAAGLFYAAVVGFQTFFLLALFMGNYFLYSAPPLRLKRVPFFSKLLVALNSLILVMLGFLFAGGPLTEFPATIIVIFLVGFTAAINFIDIKDIEGDKKMGIKTLPVILGVKKSKTLVGLFFVLAYLSFYFVIKEAGAIAVLLALGTVQFWLINRKKYDETQVLAVYLLSMVMLIAYLLLKV